MQVYNLKNFTGCCDVKRDFDLIRKLLLSIEANQQMDGTREFYPQSPDELGIQGHTVEEVAYHLRLLIEAGFVDGAVTIACPMQVIRGLTWDGHEFLDNIKNDNIWEKTKKHFSQLSGVGLRIVAAYAEAELKKHFGLT
jgi:hypothetical protein